MHSASGIPTVNFATLLHFSSASPSPGAVPTLLGLFAIVAWFDLRHGRIPDWATGAGFAGATLVGLGVPLIARWASGGRLGWGDVKLSLVLALLVGPVRAAVGLVAASVLALCGAFGSRCEAGIAFGPYLVAGMIIVLALERVYGL